MVLRFGDRTVRLPGMLIVALLGVLTIATGLLYAGTRSWLAESAHSHIQEEIRSLEQSSRSKQARLESLVAMEEAARLISGLPGIHPDVRQVGVGGQVESPDPGFSPDSPFYRAFDLHAEMETSKRKLSLSLKSMEDIEQRIREIDDRWQFIPSVTPVTGVITSRYGPRNDPFTGHYAMHYGVDISAAPGTPVKSPARGVVVATGEHGRYGRLVVVDHRNGLKTHYGHLSAVLVKKGMELKRGDIIGQVGMTGRASGYHLHYEIQKGHSRIDPMQFMRSEDGC